MQFKLIFGELCTLMRTGGQNNKGVRRKKKTVGVTVGTTLLGVLKNSVKLNSGDSCNGR